MTSYSLLYGYCFASIFVWTLYQCFKSVNGERDIASRIMDAIEEDV